MTAPNGNGPKTATARSAPAEESFPDQNLSETAGNDRTFQTPSLETIYRNAAIRPPVTGYSILRVAEMAESPHMAGMSQETRRNALLMALEAAGVDLNVLVADAISRQRALNEYEDTLLKELKEFESDKADKVNSIQAELDRVTVQCKSRIQANLEEVAREQAAFHAWQKRRQQESQRIAGAAMLLAPADTASGGDSLAALLDRATTSRM